MQKISINELVDFNRRTTDTSKRSLAYKLKHRPEKVTAVKDKDAKGGDYWRTSTSCIANVFKHDRAELYDDKINELIVKVNAADRLQTKNMHQRNINILSNFKDFNFEDIRPLKILKFEKVHDDYKVLDIEGIPLYINASVLFSFDKDGKNVLGAVWFAPKLNGYKKDELGMFCELLYKFLAKNYSDDYQISDDLCIAIDTFNAQKVAFVEMINGQTPFLISKILKEFKGLN